MVTSRLEVRPLELRDHEAWRSSFLSCRPPLNVWDKGGRPAAMLTLSRFKRTLRVQASQRANDTFYDFAVFRRRDGAYVGHTSLMQVTRGVAYSAYLGYGLQNPYWGRGYAEEAIRATVMIGFLKLKLHRIEAGIEPTNHRSRKVAKKLGMRREGLKKRMLYLPVGGGRKGWVDLVAWSLTTEDLGLPFDLKGVAPTSVR